MSVGFLDRVTKHTSFCRTPPKCHSDTCRCSSHSIITAPPRLTTTTCYLLGVIIYICYCFVLYHQMRLLPFAVLTLLQWLFAVPGCSAWVLPGSIGSLSHQERQTVVRPRTITIGSSSCFSLRMSNNEGSDAPIQTGRVKWFDTAKGFGFIVPDDGSNDVFVHQTAIQAEGFRSLANEEAVEFRVVTDKGRRKAVEVTGPNGTAVQGAPFRPSDDYDSY